MAHINNHLKSGSEIHKDAKAQKTKDALMDWKDTTFKKIRDYGAQQLNKRAPDIDGVKIPKIKYNPKK